MLTIKNLTAGYGGPAIIHDINIKIHEGEIVTLIGPNGAGKSTVMRSIFGMTSIEKGSIQLFETELVGLKTENIIREGIAYVPQGLSVFPSLTVEENLEMGAYIYNDKKLINERKDDVYERFPKIFDLRTQQTKNLSGGEQQMVAIGRALMIKPKLLLLDEPSIGLAPKIVEEVFRKCLEIKKTGTSIFMVEQNANLALAYSDRGYVLELGKNRFDDDAKKLLQNPQIGELYLGRTP